MLQMNKGNMKETTNIKIDRELKQLFESNRDLHHKSIGDAGCGTKFLYSLHSKNENTQTLFFARFYFNI
jgi:hypothetical protein